MTRLAVWLAALLALAAPPAPAAGAKPVTWKLASFVPEGSIWDKGLREMGEAWRRDTEGRVALSLFAGGQQGDEPTVVSKMRLGTLQAASLTILGLAHVDPASHVFTVPFFYDGYDELHHVMDALAPALASRLEARGFVMLGWGDAGWVHLFAKKPIRSLEDARRLPIYASAGDERMVQWYKQNGFEPRALAFTDIPSSLATGLVEAVPVTPIAALFLQWYRSAPHMVDLGLGPLVGATVVTRKAWNGIDAADQAAVREAARRLDARLRAEVPDQDREAVAQMVRRGLQVSTPADTGTWRSMGEAFGASMRGTYVPEEIFDRARAERDAFRRGASASP
jgi:TRAP-type C4-dicarboxylate transport system substrate-binding protein